MAFWDWEQASWEHYRVQSDQKNCHPKQNLKDCKIGLAEQWILYLNLVELELSKETMLE